MSASASATPNAVHLRLAQIAVTIALFAAAGAVVVAATGGFTIAIHGLRISIRSLPAPLAVFVVSTVFAFALSPKADGRRVVADWLASPQQSAPPLAAILAVAALATGLGAGTWVAGGADASGYVAEAQLLASGRLTRVEPLARDLAVEDAPRMVSPLGFRPALDARESARLVPTYAPGLPLLIAALSPIAGSAAPFLVVPLCGALAIWMTFALGRSLGHPGAGLAAALLLITNPSFLYQLVQPMSDVPAAAAWLSAAVWAVGGRAGLCGAATGLAFLIRPNLAPMAFPLAACLVASTSVRTLVPSAPRSLTLWALGIAPFVLAAGVLHTVWYGTPWRSGYGDAEALFAVDHIGPNLLRYGRWLVESCGPAAIVLAAALVRPPLAGRGRLAAACLVAAAIANVLVYVPYFVFDDWHYIRFLLPVIALLLPLGCATVVQAVARPTAGPFPWMAAATLLVVAHASWQLHQAASRDAFRLARLERRYTLTSDWLRSHTAPNAVIVTSQQSGSVTLNVPRSVLRWDLLPPGSLDHAAADVRAAGRDVWLVVEVWEQPAFAARHGAGSTLGALDWPPSAIVSADVQVRVYDTAARQRFLANDPAPTDYVFDRVR